ncbi:MmcQ/YjbR family DNA-binding protein [Actinokineospora sp.]|uniref:MmcQ/YjbR family DNA-binding protein n=1 Tax=Actinokineospora sp. TaxID=1872133 RepID=UPI00403799A2
MDEDSVGEDGVDEDDVRRVALSLPATTEKPSYGTPSFRVRAKWFARMHEDGESVVVHCAAEAEKVALIEAEPGLYFTTPHYDGYPLVQVRMAALDADRLVDVLTESWRLCAPRTLLAEFDSGQGGVPA